MQSLELFLLLISANKILSTIIMIAQLILGLSLLVFVHELGHFMAAKYFGMRVPKFYIFFDAWGKKIWSKQIGDTEYGIGWLPLGGYVQISGMIDETQDASTLSAEPEPWEFRSKPAWQRFIVMIGGIVMNVITGILIYMMFLSVFQKEYIPLEEVNKHGVYAHPSAEKIGIQTGDKIISIDGKTPTRFKEARGLAMFLGEKVVVERDGKQLELDIPEDFHRYLQTQVISPMYESVKVADVAPDSHAATAGLQKGDRMMAVDQKEIKRYSDLQDALKAKKGGDVSIQIQRNEEMVNLTSKVDTAGKLGFYPDVSYPYEMGKYNWANSFAYSVKDGYNLIATQVVAIGMLFTGQLPVSESLTSPIGIAAIYGPTWDWGHFWFITGILSFILAFMNILPIPALDGGHMVFLLYEMITGRKLSDEFLEKAQTVGIVLLLGLMIFAFGNDIYKFFIK